MTRVMRVALMACVGAGLSLVASGGEAEALSWKIAADREQALPFMPVGVTVEVRNIGNTPVTITVLEPVFEVASAEGGPWQSFWPYGVPQVAPLPPQKLTLPAGSAQGWSTVIDMNHYTSKGRTPVLETPGSFVYVRAQVYAKTVGPTKVGVAKPVGEDAKAWEWLKEKPHISLCFSKWIAARSVDETLVRECEAFVERYGKSAYVVEARKGLALVKKSAPGPAEKSAPESTSVSPNVGPETKSKIEPPGQKDLKAEPPGQEAPVPAVKHAGSEGTADEREPGPSGHSCLKVVWPFAIGVAAAGVLCGFLLGRARRDRR